MRHLAKLTVAGMIVSVGAMWVGDAQSQSFNGSGNATRVASLGGATRSADASDVEVKKAELRPTAAEIVTRMLEKNQERLAALEGYESERTYRVEFNGTGGEHRAEITVHAEYSGSDRKQLTVDSESGSKFLCEKVLRKLVESEQEAAARSNRMQTSLGPENYDAELAGEETVATPGGSVRAWVLRVSPKVDNKFTYRGKVWVSEDDYAVVRIQGEPAKSPSWWIDRANFESVYMRRGDVWLPAKNVSSSHVRIGGEATLTIEYGSYPVVTQRAAKPGVEVAAGQ